MSTKPLTGWERISVVAVSIYLIFVTVWLGKLPWLRILRAQVSPPYRGELRDIRPEIGHCFRAPLPKRLLSDMESVSRVALFEDGRLLGPGHTPHEEIRRLGRGRFSHWEGEIFFSTSDNSDPRVNGGTYVVDERR